MNAAYGSSSSSVTAGSHSRAVPCRAVPCCWPTYQKSAVELGLPMEKAAACYGMGQLCATRVREGEGEGEGGAHTAREAVGWFEQVPYRTTVIDQRLLSRMHIIMHRTPSMRHILLCSDVRCAAVRYPGGLD